MSVTEKKDKIETMNLDDVELDGVGDEYRTQQKDTESKDQDDDELPTIKTEPVGLRMVPSFDDVKIKSDLDKKLYKGQISPSKKPAKTLEQRVADVRISESAVDRKNQKEKSSRDLEDLDVVDISKDMKNQGLVQHV